MLAWVRYSEGLMAAHAALLVAYVVGASFLPSRDAPDDASASRRMTHIVCTCGLGLSIVGFVALALALLGLLNLTAIAVALSACVAIGAALRRESPLHRQYWIDRATAIGAAWDVPALAVYYLMLYLGFSAMDLSNLGSDPIAYHLAYAIDWAQTGHLMVDPFLRWVFYANNFLLLDSIFLLAHAQVLIMYLVWLTGLLTALGLLASIRWTFERANVAAPWSVTAALFLTVAVVLCPFYVRWLISAYVDAPIGAFALIATLSLVVAIREKRRDWLLVAAVVGAFLVGMKGSFLPILFVFIIALWIASRHVAAGRAWTAIVLAVLVLASSPWYVRNWIDSGDPVWPVLNIALHGSDGLMTAAEEASLALDLPNARTPSLVATAPARAFLTPGDNDFREYGADALILALYLPALALLFMLLLRVRPTPETVAVCFILYALDGYWCLTSTLLRYGLLFFPLLGFSVAVILANGLSGKRWAGPIVAAAAALALVPTSGAIPFLQQLYQTQYYLPSSYVSDAENQTIFADGYKQAEFTAAVMQRLHMRGRVYVLGWRLDYYFRLHGMQTAGDWVGPAGYFRLFRAIDAGLAPQFLESLGVTAVLVDPSRTIGRLDVPLGRQLLAAGFCAYPVPQDEYELFLKKLRAASPSCTATLAGSW